MLHNKTIEITSVLAPFKILLRIVQKKEKKKHVVEHDLFTFVK